MAAKQNAGIVERVKHARLKHAWALGFLALAFVAWTQPLALPPMVLVASNIWLGAVIGYWIDRAMFDYARPDGQTTNENWMYRRVIIVAACVIGFCLGS